METIVDQLKTVNSKSFLNEIKNPENITNLILKNFNNETNWEELNKFTKLKEIQLENCLIDKNIFFKTISKIESLNILKYDYDCVIKKSDTKINIKIPQLNKVIFVFPDDQTPNLSMLDLYDRQYEINNFITSFPSYPNAYLGLNEIELVNYDIFLKNLKEKDYDYGYSEIYEGKDIFFQCDIYNLLRLKNLKNIQLTKSDDEISENKILLEKLLSLPNTQKININNQKISNFRDKLIKAKTLLLDYEYFEPEDRNKTQVKRHNKLKDTLEVHWPSQYYHGYTNLFNEVLKSDFDNVIINTFGSFLDDYMEYYESTLDFISEKILTNKSLKKITIEIDENDYWETDSRNRSEYFVRVVREIIEKKIICSINFKNIKSKNDLNLDYCKFIEIFKFYIDGQNKENYKNFIEIKNLKYAEIENFLNNLYFNEIKSVIIIDDKSKSETLKKFKDIELLDIDLYDPYYFSIFEGAINFDKLKKKSEESFKQFYEYDFLEHQAATADFNKNPGCCVPVIRKSFLDQSKKIIFNNIEEINFYNVEKDRYANPEKIFKDQSFSFPKSINHSNIKKFYIESSPPCSLNYLRIFENLEELYFSNYVNQKDPLWMEFPVFKNLKKLYLSMHHPFMKENRPDKNKIVCNIDKCKKLEDIQLNIGVTYNYDDTRWNTTDVDLNNFNNLKNLKKLEISSIDQTLIKNLKNLENLESLEISNPYMITKDSNSDDGTIHEPLTEKDFDFIKFSKKLKRLGIYFPRFGDAKINVNIDKFLKLINNDLEEIQIVCNYEKKELIRANEWYEKITTKFKNIKKIRLSIDCSDCVIKQEYESEYDSAYQKEIRRREKNAKNPVVIDFKKIGNFNNIEELDLSFDENIGTRLKNTIELSKSKMNFLIADKIFSIKELEELFDKIATKRQKFLLNLQKKNLEKDITSYNIEEKDKEEYDLIEKEDESKLKINGNNIFDKLKMRIKEDKGITK